MDYFVFVASPLTCANWNEAIHLSIRRRSPFSAFASHVTPPDPFEGTLAADRPRIAALAATIEGRTRAGRPAQRERALLEDLVAGSRERPAARAARLPRPR
jgi:hypothetical protein